MQRTRRTRRWRACAIALAILASTAAWGEGTGAARTEPSPSETHTVSERFWGTWFIGRIKSEDPDAYGRCLDVENWGAGRLIQMWTCILPVANHQHWTIEYDGSGYVRLRDSQSRACIDAYQGRYVQVKNWPCDNSHTQDFSLEWVGPNVYVLHNRYYENTCLDVIDWGRGNGVYLWDCHYGDNQRFYLQDD